MFAFIIHIKVTQVAIAERQRQQQRQHLICKVVRAGCDVQNISTVSSDWKARGMKKQQSHSTVDLAYCWFGVSFLAPSLSHPITARRASKLSLVFGSETGNFCRSFRSSEVVRSRCSSLRRWWPTTPHKQRSLSSQGWAVKARAAGQGSNQPFYSTPPPPSWLH